MIVNVNSAVYLEYLGYLQTINNQMKTKYAPVLKKMNKAQMVRLYQHDPLFAEVVDMSRLVVSFLERQGALDD